MRIKKPLTIAIAMANVAVVSAWAQEDSQQDEDWALEEVTVTATKRETNLMETPVAISAFTQEELDRQGIKNIKDLGNTIPNVDIGYDASQSSPVISMRGVRSTNTSELGDPAVGLHFDGIYSSRPQSAMAMMFDSERVEAMRGPQGTLYGRNSTVGAINVISKKPVIDEFEGTIGVELGRWNQELVKGVINIPVSDTFALRASFMDETRDSYLTGYYDANQYDNRYIDADSLGATALSDDAERTFTQNGNWWASEDVSLVRADAEDFYGNVDQQAVRIGALWEPTEDISWYAVVEHYQDSSAGGINTIDCDKAEQRTDGVNCETYYGSGADEYTVAVNVPGKLDLSMDSFRSNFRWDFSDSMAFVYNTGYAVQNRSNLIDVDAGRNTWDMSMSITDAENVSYSHELQLQSTGDGPLQWITGLFYFHETTDLNGYFLASLDNATFWKQPERTVEASAVFAQATYSLTDTLHLTLGGRYTEDQKSDEGGNNLTCTRDRSINTDETGEYGCFPAYDQALFNELSTGYFTDNSIYTVNTYNDTSRTWSHADYRIGLDYDLTDEVMLYSYVASGFKSGGLGDVIYQFEQDPNTAEDIYDEDGNRVVAATFDTNYDEETVVTWELGAKGTFLDGRLNLASTFFFSKYKDMQLAAPDTAYTFLVREVDDEGVLTGNIVSEPAVIYLTKNAAGSEIMGLEFEFDWAPYPNGRVSGFATWMQTEITSDFENRWNFNNQALFELDDWAAAHDNSNDELYRNLKGNELPASPEFSFTINYDHTFELAHGGAIIPFIGIHWEDESYLTYWNVDKHDFPADDTSAFDDSRDAFWMVNASVKYVSPDDQWNVEAYGNNLTDEVIPYYADGSDGLVSGPFSAPTSYGVRFNYNF
ncbi:TonB-dependent receptor [Microbulbifer sp. OS29]|uniref:TonB-dependent receptor n=1 Tax=Microbulbifer okhotskensis TaxID=2926617 RepID=A0A9X2EN64_9GAMM|nr:TonB-dependent receptor [Microbulbifer okhotskensis]MCO1334779.1 TonB-dependent receptor [Microbulbifer okhotskensis]